MPRAMLYAGVTGFLDLFSEENAILELRDRQRAGTLRTPDEMLADIHAAGPVFTCRRARHGVRDVHACY